MADVKLVRTSRPLLVLLIILRTWTVKNGSLLFESDLWEAWLDLLDWYPVVNFSLRVEL
jgi:hypothetical protein